MKPKNLLKIAVLFLPLIARAVYAPIPEQEQGRALVLTVQLSAYYDSNIFGAATNTIDSMVYSVAPKLAFNESVDPQTFLSASYQPTLDYFTDRPTDKSLLSHEVVLRVAHAFSDVTNVDLDNSFKVEKNPQSLLAGVPLNTDQSYDQNEFDGRLTTALGPKTGAVFKYRNIYYAYDATALSQNLDRMEHLLGTEINYKLVPEVAALGEYRYQVINYRHAGSLKDKTSNFLLTGFDYSMGKKVTVSGRAGVEDRRRSGERSVTAPYAEATCRYDYAEQSFVSAGYIYSLAETDNPDLFTDTKMNQFFVNVQHALNSAVITSASVSVGPSTLQGRRGMVDVSETTTRLGVALTYVAGKNLTVSATYDYDDISSDLPSRNQRRSRAGVSGRFYF